jgi:serine/threonine protein kinase
MTILTVEKVHAESRAFARFHELRLPSANTKLALGAFRGEGGFGAVSEARQEGASETGQELLVKQIDLTKVKRPDLLIANVAALLKVLERCVDPAWPESVLALPFSVVAVRVDGRPSLAMFMLDLSARGYVGAPLADSPEKFRDWDSNPRIEIAFNFARRARLLEELPFVHSDVNPENMMIHPKTFDVQIIDFDAGVVVEQGDERPLSCNRPGPFMPPETKQAGSSDPTDAELFTLGAERWSVGFLIGTILFGASPALFIKTLSAQSLDAYARQGREWPDVDAHSEIFHQANRQVYANFRPLLEGAPGNVRETFAKFFAAGSNGEERPSAGEWVKAIAVARRPPSIEFVSVDREVVLEGTEALLSWGTDGADRVESPTLGELELSGDLSVRLERSQEFRLIASNIFGKTEQSSSSVRVVPLPRITSIPLPSFPGLALRANLTAPIPPVSAPQIVPPQLSQTVRLPRQSPLPRASVPSVTSLPGPPRFAALLGTCPPRVANYNWPSR